MELSHAALWRVRVSINGVSALFSTGKECEDGDEGMKMWLL